MLAVVLSFDQFPLRLLGCYGNSAVKMPCLNRIAAESVVFDQHFGEDFSPNPEGHAWWSGCYHFPRKGTGLISRMPSLPRLLAEGNVQIQWLAEDADPAWVPLPPEAPVRVLESFAQILQQGCEVLADWSKVSDRRQLLWLKAGRSAWEVSPTEEGELAKGESAAASIDSILEPLWNSIRSLAENRRVLFILTSARGMSLGERASGRESEPTWAEEIVHLPLVVFHSEVAGGERRSELTQSTDLSATLLEYFALPPANFSEGESFLPRVRGESLKGRESLTAGSNGTWESIRTRNFHLVRLRNREHLEEPRRLLFMKPDDPWDWHDVSAQEPELTETLCKQLDAFLSAAKTHLPTKGQPNVLREGESPVNPT